MANASLDHPQLRVEKINPVNFLQCATVHEHLPARKMSHFNLNAYSEYPRLIALAFSQDIHCIARKILNSTQSIQ